MSTLANLLLAGLLIFLIITGFDAIPIILFAVHPDFMRYSFDDPAAERERMEKSDVLRDWIGRLRGLGFSMLGIKIERLPLWGPAFREAALVSRTAETYASVVLNRNGDPSSLYFYTPFSGGGMVFTRNFAFGRTVNGENVSVENVPSQDFREILDSHEGRVRLFLEKGWKPQIGSGQQARIEATAGFYRSEYGRQPMRYLMSPGVLGFFFSIVSLLAAGVWILRVLR